MNGLDLFSGIGGISIALEPWVRTIAYCEKDRYAQAVLLSRMAENKLERAPIWDDIQTLTGAMLPQIDIIFGGFPCQDISVAGLGKGLEGKRSGLFFEIIRLVKEVEPSFVFLENVPAIRTRGLSTVVNEFTAIGYDCRWTCLSAASVGAPHKRDRWFLLAHAKNEGLESKRNSGGIGEGISSKGFPMSSIDGGISNVAHANREQIRTQQKQGTKCKDPAVPRDDSSNAKWWATEPAVGRVAYGIQNRVDRLKCIGNAVVPMQARKAFKKLIGMMGDE